MTTSVTPTDDSKLLAEYVCIEHTDGSNNGNRSDPTVWSPLLLGGIFDDGLNCLPTLDVRGWNGHDWVALAPLPSFMADTTLNLNAQMAFAATRVRDTLYVVGRANNHRHVLRYDHAKFQWIAEPATFSAQPTQCHRANAVSASVDAATTAAAAAATAATTIAAVTTTSSTTTAGAVAVPTVATVSTNNVSVATFVSNDNRSSIVAPNSGAVDYDDFFGDDDDEHETAVTIVGHAVHALSDGHLYRVGGIIRRKTHESDSGSDNDSDNNEDSNSDSDDPDNENTNHNNSSNSRLSGCLNRALCFMRSIFTPTLYSSETDIMESYDPVSHTWQPRASMHVPRRSFASVVANNCIYVFGGLMGSPGSSYVIKECEMYDPASRTWRYIAPDPIPRRAHHAVVLPSGVIWVIDKNYESTDIRISEFDPRSGLWRIIVVDENVSIDYHIIAASCDANGVLTLVGPNHTLVAQVECEGSRCLVKQWTVAQPDPLTSRHLTVSA